MSNIKKFYKKNNIYYLLIKKIKYLKNDLIFIKKKRIKLFIIASNPYRKKNILISENYL